MYQIFPTHSDTMAYRRLGASGLKLRYLSLSAAELDAIDQHALDGELNLWQLSSAAS